MRGRSAVKGSGDGRMVRVAGADVFLYLASPGDPALRPVYAATK
jgi:hypothetical protein